MFSDRDTGTRRLLELGIRQKLHRPLHWTHSLMICVCILSPTTCITGTVSSCQALLHNLVQVRLVSAAWSLSEVRAVLQPCTVKDSSMEALWC